MNFAATELELKPVEYPPWLEAQMPELGVAIGTVASLSTALRAAIAISDLSSSITNKDGERGGPFGAVCLAVKRSTFEQFLNDNGPELSPEQIGPISGLVVGAASNEVDFTTDPASHAEIIARSRACRTLGFPLRQYRRDANKPVDIALVTASSCEPCDMCRAHGLLWTPELLLCHAALECDARESGEFVERQAAQDSAAAVQGHFVHFPELREEAKKAFVNFRERGGVPYQPQ